jgi:serine/threonine-protein kinase
MTARPDLNSLPVQMAESLSSALALDWSSEERRVFSQSVTQNADAYELYLKGIYLWNQRTDDELHQSILAFEQAVAKDPGFALAHVGLANAYAFDLVYWPKAETAVRRALEIDPALSEAHAALGFINLFWRWDQRAAEHEFKRALELNPQNATAHQWYAVFLAANGRQSLAVGEMQRALELDPLSLPVNADLAQMLYFARDYDGAVRQGRKTLELDANFPNTHLYLYQALTQKGAAAEAIEELSAAEKLNPSAVEKFRQAFAAGGIRGFWRTRVEALQHPVPNHYLLAHYYALLGEDERALYWLEQACAQHKFDFTLFFPDPAFDDLRTNLRFQALAGRINLIGPELETATTD